MISASAAELPTGPTIVLCLSGFVTVSLLFAPGRGVVWQAVSRARRRRSLRVEAVLLDLLTLSRQHEEAHPHATGAIDAMAPGSGGAERTLHELARRGLVQLTADGRWLISESGVAEATKLERSHDKDLRDARHFVEPALVEPGRLLELVEEIEPELYRYPAIDPEAFREAVEEFVRGQPDSP